MSTIKPEELANAVMKDLRDYNSKVTNATKKSVKKVARSSAKTLRASSPKMTGEYAGNWSSKVDYETSDEIRAAVYNKAPTYRLTHLLENGHAKVNGGRVSPRVHIQPVEQSAIQQLGTEIKVGIRNC